MMMSNTPLRINEIQRRPILILKGAPYDMVVVDRDRVIDPQVFHGFSKAYLSRLPVIILPAGVMFLAWVLLLWVPARGVSMKSIWLAVALCTAFVAITPLPAGAQGQMYEEGFSVVLYDRLIWSNGVRAVLFTLVGLLALQAVHQRWQAMNRADA